jgi:cytochrome c-type biogenesis protein CcmH
MISLRKIIYAAAFALAFAASLASAPSSGQEIGQGMVRSGLVGIQNETERTLFWSLICTCGCPRETLGTCTCQWAHDRRAELRDMLKDGMPVEEVQQKYAQRFGSQALAVPPSKGGNRLLYIVPLVVIAAGAALVITILRKWSGKGAAVPAPAAPGSGSPTSAPNTKPSRDDYDDKLDEELRRMDDE